METLIYSHISVGENLRVFRFRWSRLLNRRVTHPGAADLERIVMSLRTKEDDDLFRLKRYPLVNVYRKLWKDPAFLMGKSTISIASFNSFLYVHQRVIIQITVIS